MKTTTQILPGIKTIGWLDCSKLPRRVDLHGICGSTVAVLTDVHKIEFFDKPECSCIYKKEGGGYTDTVTLTFHSSVLLPIHRHLGFVVTDVNDRSFLIGCLEPPFPQIKVTLLCGKPDGDAAGFSYEIEHVSIKSMVQCIFM